MHTWNNFLGVNGSRKSNVLPSSGTQLLFSNPSNTHKVWRVNTNYTGAITIPQGYSTVAWEIMNHLTLGNVASGANLSPTWTPTWNSAADYCNTYDVIVTCTKPGFPTIERIFPGEISVLPPTPTSEDIDISYDLAGAGIGDKDGGWTDRANIAAYNSGTNYSIGTNVKYNGIYYKARVGSNLNHQPDISPTQWKRKHAFVVRVFGTHTGSSRFLTYWWQSTDLTLPIQFYYDNAVIRTSNGTSWRTAHMYNVIHDGCGSEATAYGIDIGNNGSPGLGQRAVFDVVDNAQPTRLSHYVTICGLKVDNGSQATGGTGFQITTDETGDGYVNNWDNYQIQRCTFFNIFVTNTRDEGFYLMHTNDLDNNSPGVDFLFYRLIATNCGNETIQYSSLLGDSDVFSCRFINPGINNNSVHRNAFQFGGGNEGTAFYMNEIETSKNIFVGDNGPHGNNIYCFSNKITSTGRNASDGVNFQWTMYQSDVFSTINTRFKNNTVCIKGVAFTNVPFSLYKSVTVTTTTHDKLRMDGNLITTNTATEREFPNGWSPGAQLVMDNQQFTNIATPGFVDHTTNNYHLASTSSPAFRSRTITAAEHRMMNYDFEGYKYLAAHPVDGCYSGVELFTT